MTAQELTPAADEARPRQARMPRKARREQLLVAALEVFSDQGYHAAGMDDIAVRAGVSKPVLYQHFPGKLELYVAVLDRACDRIIEAVREALGSTHDNKVRVARTMAAFYRQVDAESGEFRLVFESDATNEPAVVIHLDRVTRECAALIAEVIEEDTDLPAEASYLLAVGLVGMGEVSARSWLSADRPLPLEDAAALVAGLAWRGISGYPMH